jgi:hypothetical protein
MFYLWKNYAIYMGGGGGGVFLAQPKKKKKREMKKINVAQFTQNMG